MKTKIVLCVRQRTALKEKIRMFEDIIAITHSPETKEQYERELEELKKNYTDCMSNMKVEYERLKSEGRQIYLTSWTKRELDLIPITQTKIDVVKKAALPDI